MRGTEFLDKMELVDPSFISCANEKPQFKQKTYKKWGIAIAACLCLFVGSLTAFAASGHATWLTDLFTARTEPESDFSESGYDLNAEVEKIPVSELNGEIQEASDIIARQIATYEPHDDHFPQSMQKEFSSSEEAIAYIGLSSIKKASWDLEEQNNTVLIVSDEKARINTVILETDYVSGDIRLQAFTYIYTEYCDEEISHSMRTTEDTSFTESFYTTASQKQCHIISSSAGERGYMCLDGYMVVDGLLHNLHITYQEDNSAQAEELLHQWADML